MIDYHVLIDYHVIIDYHVMIDYRVMIDSFLQNVFHSIKINKWINKKSGIEMLIKRERMNRTKWNNKLKPCTNNRRHILHQTVGIYYIKL